MRPLFFKTPKNKHRRVADILIERNRDKKKFQLEVKTGGAKRDKVQKAKDNEIAVGKETKYTGKKAEKAGLDTDVPTGPIKTVESHPKLPQKEKNEFYK